MTEETWPIQLGDRTFNVPRLPFRVSRGVYLICQRLTNAGLTDRLVGTIDAAGDFVAPPPLAITDEEMESLGTLALRGCQAVDPDITEDMFNAMFITPANLYDTFFAMRYACGGWRKEEKKMGEGESPLETPPT